MHNLVAERAVRKVKSQSVRAFVALLIVGLSLLLASWLGRQSGIPAGPSPSLPSTGDAMGFAQNAAASDGGNAEGGETSTLPAPHPLSETLCPTGMAWVQGRFCARPNEHTGEGCRVPTLSVAVCMDEFEYPNQQGVYPAVMIDPHSARRTCAAEGKRLCRDWEWTLACQSTLEPAACRFGHTDKLVRVERLHDAERVSEELAAHDGRRQSQPTACVNHSRIFDLLGNVQEWVQSEQPHFEGSLKGGRYNQGLIGCERSIQVRDRWASYPHTGLRCCKDPLIEMPGLK